jgi:hypothetical protein
MKNESFEEFPWHDSTLLELRVDRRRAGHVDEVVLAMLWPDGHRSRIRFVDCYEMEAKMNFGVVAAETVFSATERRDSEELQALRAKWQRIGVDLSGLRAFSIVTNSTGSRLTIYSQGWVEDLEDRADGGLRDQRTDG